MINELKFTVKDDKGRVLDNHGQPISVVVEIQQAIKQQTPSASIYPDLEAAEAFSTSSAPRLQRGTFLVVIRCNEVTKDPISSTGVQIVTVMCDVTIADGIRIKPEISNKI